ncbi:MAG TPA: hypothetical protein VFK31_09640 [Rhodanobacteraceae bacterium]|nr:hypothetical protein [Rhodanobacteraceae bacterium]
MLQQGDTDWLPEKFRVQGEDGNLDVDASARKLAQSYGELEKNRPSGKVPEKPEDYAPEGLPEGVDFDEIKADPIYQGFLRGAHAKGLTNDQVSYVLGQYMELVPDLLEANVRVSADEARAELGKVWQNDQAMTQGLTSASKAVRGFGAEGDVPGSAERLMAKYGNDPDFLAFAAAVGKEMQEDQPIAAGSPAAQDWDGKVAKLKADPAYNDPDHPEHKQKIEEMRQLYNQRFGQKGQRLGATAVR